MSAWSKVCHLTNKNLYNETSGYGYVNTCTRQAYSYLMINELSNNFKPNKEQDPIYIRVQVPKEGNYKVTLTLAGREAEAIIKIFAQRRNCVVQDQVLNFGKVENYEFIVNVSAIIPNRYQDFHQDTGIDITVLGNGIECRELKVEEVKGITLFMMGDSTMADQAASYPYDPFNSYCGWGQMLPLFLKSNIAVANHAHSGKTTLSFRKEGHFDVIENRLKVNDFVVIQFGHNDQKEKDLMAYEGYRNELKRYIRAIQAKGAYPILITPLSRNLWNGPGYSFNDLLLDYAKSCKQIAAEEEIPLIDLHKRSMEWIVEEGPIEAIKYFYTGDFTHTNDYGGFKVAGIVAKEIKKRHFELSSYIKETTWSITAKEELTKWERPSLEAFYTLVSEWQLKNEWVKEILYI